MPVVGDVTGLSLVRAGAGGLWYWKSGAFLSWSLVQDTFSFTLVGSASVLAAPTALVEVPVLGGTTWNALMSGLSLSRVLVSAQIIIPAATSFRLAYVRSAPANTRVISVWLRL